MKCPHCFCNYDDSERECPMCGTRRGVAACWDARHKSITHSRTSQSGGRVVPASRPVQAKTSERKTHAPGKYPAAPQRSTASWDSGRTAKKAQNRRGKAVGWVVVVFVLLQLLPALLGLVSEVFASVRHDMEFRDDGFHFFSEGAEGYAAAPEPEPKPEPGYETGEVLLSGAYLSEDTGLSLTIDNDALTYQLILDDFEQSGDFYLEYNDPDTSMDYYTEEFPPEEYSSYLLALWHTEDWDEDAVSCTLVNVYVALDEPSGRFYLDNTFADAPWLPLDRAIVMERQDIG